jgi:hypothetical protein
VVADPAEPAAPAAEEAAESVADEATQTLEKEEAELQAQIDDYAKAPSEPAAASDSAPADNVSSSNEATLADAVKELNSPAEEPPLKPPSAEASATAPVAAVASPTPTPAGTPGAAPTPDAPNDNVSVTGKKVIQPINAVAKPNLDVSFGALLEQHGDDLPSRAVTEKLPQPFLMPRDAMSLDQGDKVFGAKAKQRRLGEVGVG